MKEVIRYVYKKGIRRIVDEKYGFVSYVDKAGTPRTTNTGTWLRLDRGKPIGCIFAIGPGRIGWSKCDKYDTFVKGKGRRAAQERAVEDPCFTAEDISQKVPYALRKTALEVWGASFGVRWDA